MVWTYPYGIDNTHGIDLSSWYSICTPESHTADNLKHEIGFIMSRFVYLSRNIVYNCLDK